MTQFYIGNGSNMGQPKNPFSSLISLLVGIGFIVLIYFIIAGFIKFLYWCAPVFLILAFLIERQVVFQYAARLTNNFNTSVLQGIIWVVFLVFCYPFVFFWLFIKSLFYNRIQKIAKKQEDMFQQFGNFGQQNVHQKRNNKDDEWTDYEEIK